MRAQKTFNLYLFVGFWCSNMQSINNSKLITVKNTVGDIWKWKCHKFTTVFHKCRLQIVCMLHYELTLYIYRGVLFIKSYLFYDSRHFATTLRQKLHFSQSSETTSSTFWIKINHHIMDIFYLKVQIHRGYLFYFISWPDRKDTTKAWKQFVDAIKLMIYVLNKWMRWQLEPHVVCRRMKITVVTEQHTAPNHLKNSLQ